MQTNPAKRRKQSHTTTQKDALGKCSLESLYGPKVYAGSVDNSPTASKPAEPEIVATLNAGY